MWYMFGGISNTDGSGFGSVGSSVLWMLNVSLIDPYNATGEIDTGWKCKRIQIPANASTDSKAELKASSQVAGGILVPATYDVNNSITPVEFLLSCGGYIWFRGPEQAGAECFMINLHTSEYSLNIPGYTAELWISQQVGIGSSVAYATYSVQEKEKLINNFYGGNEQYTFSDSFIVHIVGKYIDETIALEREFEGRMYPPIASGAIFVEGSNDSAAGVLALNGYGACKSTTSCPAEIWMLATRAVAGFSADSRNDGIIWALPSATDSNSASYTLPPNLTGSSAIFYHPLETDGYRTRFLVTAETALGFGAWEYTLTPFCRPDIDVTTAGKKCSTVATAKYADVLLVNGPNSVAGEILIA